jgi:hypothetical protein
MNHLLYCAQVFIRKASYSSEKSSYSLKIIQVQNCIRDDDKGLNDHKCYRYALCYKQ